MGDQDKFNEIKNKVSDSAGDAKDKAEELYNKAKESPVGEKLDDFADSAKEKAKDVLGKFKGDKGA
ncbi:YtxH domain-containing protein [Glycomyces sp. NPDC046736]|uniref:YtxH domain-containing protein n=1 Tax=Glycomyces sp. NPDC046736 TaxID=3155615 RepID=UPI0033F5F58C